MRSLAALLLLAACTPAASDDDPSCMGGKCDVPDDPAETLCPLRRADAMNPNQRAYTPDGFRWSCNDAAGVTEEDRGQEYCEYFAVATLPGEQEPRVLGRNLGDDSSAGTTPPGVELDSEQISALEQDALAVVGQCVFTTWQSDYQEPPACGADCPTVWGLPIDDVFRMKFYVNSTEAAQMLVTDCFKSPTSEEADDFTRGCMLNDAINQTSYRKSDTTLCAAVMRLSECGCSVPGGADFENAIAPWEQRAFPLGTWSSPTALPPGCRYVDLGDASRALVTCDLTAADLLYSPADAKERCREKYADDVVVHVPIPSDAISCSPPTDGKHSSTCGAQPWVVD